MSEDRFDKIKIGDEQEFSHTITKEDVAAFVKLTGDNNPLHVDGAYAARTSFKRPVVHGMLTASFISTMIGTRLPGKGALWYEQKIRFLAPVYVGEKIRILAKVKHKSLAQRILILDTAVFTERGKQVVQGEARVKVLGSATKENFAIKEETQDRIPQSEAKINRMASKKKKGAVIISGASRGIGAAVAKELAHLGYPVVVNYSRSEIQADDIVHEIKSNKGKAMVVRADVSSREAVQKMVDLTLSEFKHISGIVNNASFFPETLDFTQLSWDMFQKHIDVQVKGAFHLTKAVLPHFLENQQGIIVNIASIYADNVPPLKLMPYSMAKAALVTFSKSLAVEYGHKGIRVNCVSPGMTNTDFIADVPEKVKMVTKMQTPLRRLAEPEDIAGTVAFLFSDKAAFITGQNFRVCGGIVMT